MPMGGNDRSSRRGITNKTDGRFKCVQVSVHASCVAVPCDFDLCCDNNPIRFI